jgi:CRISPR-associated protein Cas8c/Csp2
MGIYLSPNSITTDMLAKNTWKAANELLKTLNGDITKKTADAKMSIVPISGEYLSFSTNGGIGRGKPKSLISELGLSMITTLTPYKPCLQDRGENTCIIPDLPLKELIDFVLLFKDMLQHKSSNDLTSGRVKKTISTKKKFEQITYKPLRPNLFNGNFPSPPKSTTLGGISLLATIGEFCKEAQYSSKTLKVLETLKQVPIYLIKYGNASAFTYNHFIIDLAKTGNLRQIVDSIYYSKLYNQSPRDYNNTEYQKFDLFTARFLQLFNSTAFKDFLSFRAEYPHQIEILFNTYFTKMENIDSTIVKSARQLGKWLNLVAYLAAKSEIKDGIPNYWEKLREQKAKVLVELESAAFSAKTGHALLAQVITRAGRLSGMDVPTDADIFMEKAMSGELKFEQAQNLIIAFSRLKNTKEVKEVNQEDLNIDPNEKGSNEDL